MIVHHALLAVQTPAYTIVASIFRRRGMTTTALGLVTTPALEGHQFIEVLVTKPRPRRERNILKLGGSRVSVGSERKGHVDVPYSHNV